MITSRFTNTLNHKRLENDKFKYSIKRKILRIKKSMLECNQFNTSEYKSSSLAGFKGGKTKWAVSKRNSDHNISTKQNINRIKQLTDDNLWNLNLQKFSTIYSPKPKFIYNLSLYTKKKQIDEPRYCKTSYRRMNSYQQNSSTLHHSLRKISQNHTTHSHFI